MNVLETRRGSGTYVSSLAVSELLEPLGFALELTNLTSRSLFEVRLALEPLAAALAADRANEEQRETFGECSPVNVVASPAHRSSNSTLSCMS